MVGEGGLMVGYLNIRCLAPEASAVQIARIHLVFGSAVVIAPVRVAIRLILGVASFILVSRCPWHEVSRSTHGGPELKYHQTRISPVNY